MFLSAAVAVGQYIIDCLYLTIACTISSHSFQILNNLWDKYDLFIVVEIMYMVCLFLSLEFAYHTKLCILEHICKHVDFLAPKIIDIISAVPLNNTAQQRKYRFAVGKFAENQGHNPQKWFECQMRISQYMTKHIHEYKRMCKSNRGTTEE